MRAVARVGMRWGLGGLGHKRRLLLQVLAKHYLSPFVGSWQSHTTSAGSSEQVPSVALLPLLEYRSGARYTLEVLFSRACLFFVSPCGALEPAWPSSLLSSGNSSLPIPWGWWMVGWLGAFPVHQECVTFS